MRITRVGYAAAAVAAMIFLFDSCSSSPSSPSNGGGTGVGGGGGATGTTAVVVAVGDIGMCGRAEVAQTARLVAAIEGAVLLAGDIAYFQGTDANFRDCFDPSWGQFRSRWHPVPGNHEYESAGAAPYFRYFGDAAMPNGNSYYSVNSGDWLILMLDSNIPATAGSSQYEFARTRLAEQRTPCTMAVWHHPLFSSGPNGSTTQMRDMWALLESHRVEVILNGHDHLYERFARQMSDGRADPTNGIRQFTAGTGGAELYNFVRAAPNSEARIMKFGVVKFTLRPAQVDWEFRAIDGTVGDSGLDTCR